MFFCETLIKILNTVPNPRIPARFHHILILIKTHHEHLAKIRIIGIIWKIVYFYFSKNSLKDSRESCFLLRMIKLLFHL